MAPEQPLLEVDGLAVAYGKVEAVRSVSLTIRAGQIVTVIGPNGAGKSTLLNALAGLRRARHGTVRFAGRSLAGIDTETRVRDGLVIVPEKRELFGAMSVQDNLLLGGFAHRRRGDLRDKLADVYRRFPKLQARREQLAATLSGGERQMLAIGRALMSSPRLLMLDEPSLGLAPLISRDIFTIIAELRHSGVSILLVEQNARAALKLADHGYVLESGEIALEGPAAALAANPRVVETYLGLAGAAAASGAPVAGAGASPIEGVLNAR